MSAPGAKLWGGRFERPPDESFYEFQRSFPFDYRLLSYELRVNRVWARGLERAGLLTADEAATILKAIDRIEARAYSEPAWVQHSTAEDVHHFAELALVELTGEGRAVLLADRRRREGWLASAIAEDLSADEQQLLVDAVALLRRLAES